MKQTKLCAILRFVIDGIVALGEAIGCPKDGWHE
jgi:hypothetical protein